MWMQTFRDCCLQWYHIDGLYLPSLKVTPVIHSWKNSIKKKFIYPEILVFISNIEYHAQPWLIRKKNNLFSYIHCIYFIIYLHWPTRHFIVSSVSPYHVFYLFYYFIIQKIYSQKNPPNESIYQKEIEFTNPNSFPWNWFHHIILQIYAIALKAKNKNSVIKWIFPCEK